MYVYLSTPHMTDQGTSSNKEKFIILMKEVVCVIEGT